METLRFLLVTTFYPPYHIGGDAVHVRYLANALAARGHEVHVEFAPEAFRLKRPRAAPSTGPADSVELHPIPSRFGRAQPLAAYVLGRSRGTSRFHADLVRKVSPDVIHHHNISLLGLGRAHPELRARSEPEKVPVDSRRVLSVRWGPGGPQGDSGARRSHSQVR